MAERHGTWQATHRYTPPVDVQLITAGFLAHESLQPSSLPTPRGSGMRGWQLFAYSCGGSVGIDQLPT